jgi:hypothetical protein
MATVEVSRVSIDPSARRVSNNRLRGPVEVTIQIFHTPLERDQTVTVNVGTFSTRPAEGITVTYEPGSQRVRLVAGPSGVVVATARIMNVDIGESSTATIVVAASVTEPTSGLKIVNANPSLQNHLATVRVTKR